MPLDVCYEVYARNVLPLSNGFRTTRTLKKPLSPTLRLQFPVKLTCGAVIPWMSDKSATRSRIQELMPQILVSGEVDRGGKHQSSANRSVLWCNLRGEGSSGIPNLDDNVRFDTSFCNWPNNSVQTESSRMHYLSYADVDFWWSWRYDTQCGCTIESGPVGPVNSVRVRYDANYEWLRHEWHSSQEVRIVRALYEASTMRIVWVMKQNVCVECDVT